MSTRRACSVRRETHEAMLELSKRLGLSVSQIIERSVMKAVNGEIDLGEPVPAHMLAIATKRERTKARPGPSPAEVAADKARVAAANIPAGLRDPMLEMSTELGGLVADIARRSGADPSIVLGAAVERMVTHLAANPGSWCDRCLQQLGDCNCKTSRSIAGEYTRSRLPTAG